MAAFLAAEHPRKGDKTSPCRVNVKRLLIGCCLLASVVGLYLITSLIVPPSDVDFSSEEVSELIQQWAEDHPVQKPKKRNRNDHLQEPIQSGFGDNWMLGDKNDDIRNSVQQQLPLKSPKHVPSNRERSKAKTLARFNQLSHRYDLEVEKMASHNTGQPVYVDYDMRGTDTDSKFTFDCVTLKVQPPIPICLYPDAQDVFVSAQIRKDGLWEAHIMARFTKALASDFTIGVIDLGANLGQYSLVAAARGHPVLAVEPWEPSLQRLRHAAKLAGIEGKIRVLKNVVSNSRGVQCLNMNPDNHGDVHIIAPVTHDGTLGKPGSHMYSPEGGSVNSNSPRKTPGRNTQCQHSVISLYMNDLLPKIPFRKALLKIDIQGEEHRAFLHVDALLNTVFVPHIFMEWVIMRGFWVTASHASLDKALVQHLVKVLTHRGYHVFSLVSGRELDIRHWFGWPEDVIWSHKSIIK